MIGLSMCPECHSRSGHTTTCSQHPSNKVEVSDSNSFNLNIGGTEQKVDFGRLTDESIREVVPATRDENGIHYVLDEIKGTHSWYVPGTGLTVDNFYTQATKRESTSNYLPKDLAAGQVKVSYAVDADGDGIADKYQARILYDLGNGLEEEQRIEVLGHKADLVLVPGEGKIAAYAEEGSVNLMAKTAAEKENQTFTGWQIEGDGQIRTITESKDDNGNTILTLTDSAG